MTKDHESARPRRVAWIALGLLGLIVASPLLLPGPPPVEAQPCSACRYSPPVLCKPRCASTSRAMNACIARTRQKQVGNCRAVFESSLAACSDGGCKADARRAMRACVKSAAKGSRVYRKGSRVQPCERCCRSSQLRGSCGRYFSGPFYGAFFSQEGLRCPGDYGGPPKPRASGSHPGPSDAGSPSN